MMVFYCMLFRLKLNLFYGFCQGKAGGFSTAFAVSSMKRFHIHFLRLVGIFKTKISLVNQFEKHFEF